LRRSFVRDHIIFGCDSKRHCRLVHHQKSIELKPIVNSFCQNIAISTEHILEKLKIIGGLLAANGIQILVEIIGCRSTE
tara:strand:- start:2836 stop:3072 length:237 start_codon:yes stop_codon:yes gene_type:complete